jgi:hypothetical protein
MRRRSQGSELRHQTTVMLQCCTALGQTKPTVKDSLVLGGVELTIGMASDVVIARLAGDNNITKIAGDDNALMIRWKAKSPEESGEVMFKNKKLVYAERDWSSASDAVSFLYALRSILIQFGSEGRHVCLVVTGGSQGADGQSQNIALICGAKRLEMSVNEVFSGPYQGKSTSLQEVIGSVSP